MSFDVSEKLRKEHCESQLRLQRSLAGVEDRQRLLGQKRKDGRRLRKHGRGWRRRRWPRQRRGHRRLEGGLDVLQEEAGIRGEFELSVGKSKVFALTAFTLYYAGFMYNFLGGEELRVMQCKHLRWCSIDFLNQQTSPSPRKESDVGVLLSLT